MIDEETKNIEVYKSDGCQTWADLEAAYTADNPDLQKLSKSIFRDVPNENNPDQQKLFTPPPLMDITGKDDISLMDLCPFGLEKKPRQDVIKYSLTDADVTIQGGTGVGMATVYDYDIILYITAHLTYQMNKVKEAVANGANPSLPSRSWQPDMHNMLEFMRRRKGGKQYTDLEAALDRLQNTNIKIKEKGKGSFRRTASFPLIGGYWAVHRNNKKEMLAARIAISPWMYDGIVRVEKPTVLAINNNYFLLKDGIHRALARLARKSAGTTGKEIVYNVEKIHHQFGSKQPLGKFSYEIKKKIERLKKQPIPDYEIKYFSKGKGKNFISFCYIGEKKEQISMDFDSPILKPETYAKASEAAPTYDVYTLESNWQDWIAKKKGHPANPDAAFIGFCKKIYQSKPNP